MGNAFASLMLVFWPVVCVAFFTRLSVERALVWSIIGGYMLLPPLTEFDFPLVPDLDKFTIPNVTVLAIMLGIMGMRPSFWPTHRITQFVIIVMLASTIPTVMTNLDANVFRSREDADPISFEVFRIPGLRVIDIFSMLSSQLIMLIPFFLARHYLSTDRGLREMMFAFFVAGLAYSLPALFEVRLSPQLNTWIYGFFQHDFEQMMRDGGFRPIVFMPHPLWLVLFFTMAMCAGAALMKQASHDTRWRYMAATLYLLMVIFLCKSLATQLYSLLLLPMILFASPKWQVRAALGLAAVAVMYPMLRGLHLIPLDWILQQAEMISPARANSLEYRFYNEEQLLARAAERPIFGWGEWGRNLVHHPRTGEILTIPDGRWILVFGSYGWAGYLTQMGVVALPLLMLNWYMRRQPEGTKLSPLIAPLSLMLGITMLDMLLNDTLVPMTWLMVGAILGYAERLAPAPAQKNRYRRGEPIIGGASKSARRSIM